MDNSKKIEWVLRIGVAGEFFGHGMLALGGKADWIKWIGQMAGTDPVLSGQLLWWVGATDVLVALLVLVKPIRIVLLWAVFWGFWTALVRPLVGVGWLDFIERWANWAAPFALLLMQGWPRSLKEWLKVR
jgi:hypothetical protein